MDFTGTIVWVTGASAGIGHASVQGFLDAGAVVVATSRSAERLADACAGLDQQRLHLLPCDVASEVDVERAHAAIVKDIGPVDVLINNAGTTVFRSFLDSSVDDFDRLHRTNLRGPFLCTRSVLPGMLEKGKGTIVMVSSMAAIHAFPDSSVYSATKAGLKAMADCLRLEVRKSGVRVVTVFPGATNTEIWPSKLREKYGEKMMHPSDVAAAILHVCSAPHGVMYEDVSMQPIGGGL